MSVDWLILQSAISLLLLLIQAPAAFILLSRLLKGPSRRSPVEPHTATPELFGAVSVVVPTLNEAERISPCLAGLTRQSYEVREIIVVDSRSQDGTPDLVKAAQQKDPRFRLINDDPLPSGWVGRPWALHNGFLHMAGLGAGDKGLGTRDNSQSPIPNPQFPIPNSQFPEWFLGIDADTQPSPGLVAGLVKAAEAEGYDLVSLSPQFILKYPGEWWLQPALLMTLLYRFDPAGTNTQDPSRVMANGQCFLCRRSVLEAVGGYTSARSSFCDDVTLARNIASGGFKVGFLDGAKVLKVRMYEGAAETWNEWGRSLDLKDASSSGQIWGDLWLLTCTQGLPLLASFILLSWLVMGNSSIPVLAAAGLNLFLLLIRFALLLAIAPSYESFMRSPHVAPLNDRVETRNFPFLHLPVYFYLSPLADPLAVLRIFLSAFRTPKQWRGRNYG
ncbi:glycosyltransferase [Trichocoleus sp. FACHB-6]|uniref:glycosyltransferase n=1 Tax=Cyanophyceae TaxID=3028117 RepID=UPI0016880F78|nr:glycosyltransferase [Trichocoleus sp. FACHB-832]MBD2062041.1 glycosyltransferase [Trichocoleus sp. FACHB-6]